MTISSVVVGGPHPQQYVAVVTVLPADTTLDIELWRAPDNGSGAPNDGAAVLVARLPPQPISGGRWADPLPPDGVTYYYKARHVGYGVQASAFTSYSNGVTAQPVSGPAQSFTRAPTLALRLSRDLSLADGLYAAQATDAGGTILPAGNVQTDGAQSRTLAKGVVTGAGAGGSVSRDTGTASAGTTTTLSDSTKSWTTNQWAGGWVVITGGTGSGQVAKVSSNTATQLTISGTWTAPASGSTYTVTAWIDGAAVTFPVSYQNAPTVVLHEGQGLSHEPRAAKWTGDGVNAYASTLPEYDQTNPVSVNAAGFVLRSRLMQKTSSTLTSQNSDFGTGNAITVVGHTAASAALSAAPSYNDQYTVQFKVVISWDTLNKGIVQSVTVAIDSAADGLNYTQIYTQTFQITPTAGVSGSHTWGDNAPVLTVSGLGSSSTFRLRVTAAGGEQTFNVHGYDLTDDGLHGVLYSTISAAQPQIYAAKTPDAGDSLSWEAKVIT